MKKLLSCLVLGLSFVAVGCSNNSNNTTTTSVVSLNEEFTVAFVSEGERFKTLKIEKGNKIETEVSEPSKSGYKFLGWYIGDEKINLSEYTVTGNVTFTAKFEEIVIDTEIDVNQVKEEGKVYTLVIGWWECTDLKEDGSKKLTSYLDETRVKMFYSNLALYLRAKGVTDEELSSVSIRNYSTNTVSEMGEKVLLDGDVSLMIGVGNNVNSSAGLTLYESDNANKFQTNMGQADRYVALLSSTNSLGINVYDWLRTDTGKESFLKVLEESQIEVVPERSNEINLKVTVHGNTDLETILDSEDKVVVLPEITIPEGKEFDGFSLTEGGERALNVAIDAELKYDNLKTLINVGDSEINLYPLFKDSVIEERTHYAVIAWYNKETTSGLNETIIEEVKTALFAYLRSHNVSEADIATIEFKGYEGNVGPSTEAIVNDGDVDIMLGWGSNISSSGSIPASSVVNAWSNYEMGAKTGRYVHILSSDESVTLVSEFLASVSLDNFKAPANS